MDREEYQMIDKSARELEAGGDWIIQRPRAIRETKEWGSGLTWIELTAYQLKSQATLSRGQDPIEIGKDVVARFKLLAPPEFPEDLTHTWETYESLASRALQKGAEIGKAFEAGESVFKTLTEGTKGTKEKKRILTLVNERLVKAGSARAFHFRIDTPLTYQGSERRKYILSFNFIDEGDPYQDVLYPIRLLQRLSSPEMGAGIMSLRLPYIFTVESTPLKELLYVKYAALDKVTPTYYGPYIDGCPMRATVELGFTDLEPLYRSSFAEMKPRVTVSESGLPPEERLSTLQKLSQDLDKTRASIREANRLKSAVFTKGIGIPNTAKSYLDEVSRAAL